MSTLLQSGSTRALLGPQAVSGVSTRDYATRADWNRHFNTIKWLYVDEDKTLKEVMKIMARDYNHRGTLKMYKSRITKWKLDKKTKEPEALAILRIKARRDLLGKGSSFRVRGKPVTVDDVYRYFKRKGVMEPSPRTQEPEGSTPPAVECFTPPATPRPGMTRLQSEEIDNFLNSCTGEFGSLETALSYANDMDADIFGHLGFHQTQQFIFSDPRFQSYDMPQSILPPRSCVVLEALLTSISNYYTGALSSTITTPIFRTDQSGHLVHGTRSYSDSHFEFQEICLTGLGLMQRGSFVEGRRCFSKASTLISEILKHQDPRALDTIFETLIHISSADHDAITSILRTWMRDLAIQRLPVGHPWIEILSHVSYLEAEHVQFALLEAWRCICNTLTTSVGRFHTSVLNMYSEFLWRSNDANSPQILSGLLHTAELQLGQEDQGLMLLKYNTGNAFSYQARYIDAIKIFEDVINTPNINESLKGNVISGIATCQYKMGMFGVAEAKRREAIALFEGLHGKSDSSVLYDKAVLAEWLREWGRDEEAAVYEAEMDDAIGPDDIDLEYAS